MSSSDSMAATADPVDGTAAPELDCDTLYRVHAPAVTRWVSRLAGPDADVDDIVQEVFMAAAAGRFRGEAKITTWLYRITARKVSRWRRRSWWQRFSPFGDDGPDRYPAMDADPETAAAQRQKVSLLYKVLDRLSEKDREVLILHELEGLSGPDIARLWSCTDNAVWVRLHRARQRFERALGAISKANVGPRTGPASPDRDSKTDTEKKNVP